MRIKYHEAQKSELQRLSEIRKTLYENDLFIAILYFKTNFRPKNYVAPLEKKVKKLLNPINVNQMKFDVLYFQNTIIEQDNKILFDYERELTNMITIDNIKYFSTFRTDEQLDEYYRTDEMKTSFLIYNSLFIFDQTYKKYTRKYMKLQDVFGNVNGFMDFVIFDFSVISFYTNYRFDYFLFNEFVNVKVDKKLLVNFKDKEMNTIKSNIINNKYNDNSDISCVNKGKSICKQGYFLENFIIDNENYKKDVIHHPSKNSFNNDNPISITNLGSVKKLDSKEAENNSSGISAVDCKTSRNLVENPKPEDL